MSSSMNKLSNNQDFLFQILQLFNKICFNFELNICIEDEITSFLKSMPKFKSINERAIKKNNEIQFLKETLSQSQLFKNGKKKVKPYQILTSFICSCEIIKKRISEIVVFRNAQSLREYMNLKINEIRESVENQIISQNKSKNYAERQSKKQGNYVFEKLATMDSTKYATRIASATTKKMNQSRTTLMGNSKSNGFRKTARKTINLSTEIPNKYEEKVNLTENIRQNPFKNNIQQQELLKRNQKDNKIEIIIDQIIRKSKGQEQKKQSYQSQVEIIIPNNRNSSEADNEMIENKKKKQYYRKQNSQKQDCEQNIEKDEKSIVSEIQFAIPSADLQQILKKKKQKKGIRRCSITKMVHDSQALIKQCESKDNVKKKPILKNNLHQTQLKSFKKEITTGLKKTKSIKLMISGSIPSSEYSDDLEFHVKKSLHSKKGFLSNKRLSDSDKLIPSSKVFRSQKLITKSKLVVNFPIKTTKEIPSARRRGIIKQRRKGSAKQLKGISNSSGDEYSKNQCSEEEIPERKPKVEMNPYLNPKYGKIDVKEFYGFLTSLKESKQQFISNKSIFFSQQNVLWQLQKRNMQKTIVQRKNDLSYQTFDMDCKVTKPDRILEGIRDDIFEDQIKTINQQLLARNDLDQVELEVKRENDFQYF